MATGSTEHSRTFICEEDDREYFWVTSHDGSTWIESQSEYDHMGERCYMYSSKLKENYMYINKTPHVTGGTGDWVINVMIGNGFKHLSDFPMSYGVPFNAVYNMYDLKVGQHPDLKINLTRDSKGITYTLLNGEEEVSWLTCSVNCCSCLQEGGDWEPVYVYNDTMVGIYNDSDEESLVLFRWEP